MDVRGQARFRPQDRLRTGADFRRVFRQGLRLDGPLFSLVAALNPAGTTRLGLAASRKMGGAVARNRAKRLLRESFRRNLSGGPQGFDLVLIPKREILERTQSDVCREYRERLRRLLTRRAAGSRSQAPAPRH